MNEWKVRLLTTSNSMLAFNILQICYIEVTIRINSIFQCHQTLLLFYSLSFY